MQDAITELDRFRSEVSCAALLERHQSPWKLDAAQSTARAKKYRRGKGEILIITHDDRGWWEPGSDAKGDVFGLVQHLDPTLNFGQVRVVLRTLVGATPSHPSFKHGRADGTSTERQVSERWEARPRLRRGSAGWTYLCDARGLSASVMDRAANLDIVREGFKGSVWFAHRSKAAVTHVEVRGPEFRVSLRGGHKTLFQFAWVDIAEDGLTPDERIQKLTRLAVTEAPIDALSLAALEGRRSDTVYLASGGGMGPGTADALQAMLDRIATAPEAVLVSAADADPEGDRYAERHAELAATAGVLCERLRPTTGKDWNDMLRQGRPTLASRSGLTNTDVPTAPGCS